MEDFNLMMNKESAPIENSEQSEISSTPETINEADPSQADPSTILNDTIEPPIPATDESNPNESVEQIQNDEPTDEQKSNDTTVEELNNANDEEQAGAKESESKSENGSENETEDTKRRNNEEESIDPIQCRICLTKENLVDIFTVDSKTHFRISDLIMKLCTTVKISERDYLPHYVCSICVQRIDAAWELRKQCEETEKLLRSKLKRSKRTTRHAPSEFVLISAIDSSSESNEDDNKSDDEEFQISEESEESSESDSDASFEEKKKPTQIRRRRPPPPSKSQTNKRFNATPMYQPSKQARLSNVVHIPAADSDDEKKLRPNQAKKITKVVSVFRCEICSRFCPTAEALQQHRRTHIDEKCPICSKIFKQRSILLQHIQRHKDERICGKCHKEFATKNDCKRHYQTVHSQPLTCDKCKRSFPTKIRLDGHKCADESGSKRKFDTDSTNSGRDLFKSVAPLTTTYWSDSFSD